MAKFEKREGTKLSFLPFIALSSKEAPKAHPNIINASVEGDDIVYHGKAEPRDRGRHPQGSDRPGGR